MDNIRRNSHLLIKSLIFSVLALILAGKTVAQSPVTPNVNMIAVTPYLDSLWMIDTTNFTVTKGMVVAATTLSSGDTIIWTTAMATNPVTGEIYVVTVDKNNSGRSLGIMDLTSDPDTAWVTFIGNTGDNFAGLAFLDGTRLAGVTGDGAGVVESYYTINKNTAVATIKAPLGNGGDGETIAFDYDDGKVYHYSGRGPAAVTPTPFFGKIDTASGSEISIGITGSPWDEMKSLYYLGCDEFMASDNNQGVFLIDTAGLVSSTAFTSYDWWKGITFPLTNNFLMSDDTLYTGVLDTLWIGIENNRGDIVVINWGDGSTNDTINTCQTVTAWHKYNIGTYTIAMTTIFSGKKMGVIPMVTKEIKVFSCPFSPVGVISAGPLQICAGDSVELTADLISNATYSWWLNGLNIGVGQSIFIDTAGTYKVIVSQAPSGCTDSSGGTTLIVDPGLPNAGFTQSADTIWAGQSVSVTDTSTGKMSGYYEFGDGGAADSTLNTAHQFTDTGTFTIMQIVTNSCGNDTATSTIVVTDTPIAVIGLVSFENLKAFPNPFATETAIEFEMAEPAEVSIGIFDLKGGLIIRLAEGELAAGRHRMTWNGKDLSGNEIANGTYLFTFKAGTQQVSRQLIKME